MTIYLPVAEMSANLFVLIALGAGIGLLSGVFGVGGGFLLTPLLISYGVSPVVAVGSGAAQVLASSVSGVLAHWRRGAVDPRMGGVLVAGGALGSVLGVALFNYLRSQGIVETFITLAYVLFLGAVGLLMLSEGLIAIRRARRAAPAIRRKHGRLQRLPWRVRFPRSGLYVSALLPLVTGVIIGILTSTMGVGGGIMLIPAMIYLIGVPSAVVVGTSLFQLCFTSATSTILHAVTEQSVDILLVIVLTVGGVVGAQLGAQLGTRLRGEETRILLAIMILLLCGRLAFGLIETPPDLFSIAR